MEVYLFTILCVMHEKKKLSVSFPLSKSQLFYRYSGGSTERLMSTLKTLHFTN